MQKTYKHYIDGTLIATYPQHTTRKRHALAHYRHTKRIALVRDIATRIAIVTLAAITLAVTYLVATN